MSSRPSGKADRPSGPPPAVRILDIPKGASVVVRLLSYNPLGNYTHWNKDHSEPCRGDDCPRGLHLSGALWKSWQAAEVWNERAQLWYGTVLEVTENLELDMRGIAARGQVWEVFRPVRKKGKRNSVQGQLLEERDPATFPRPFNVQDVLRCCFHVDCVEMSIANPMPPRLLVEASRDEGPRKFNVQSEEAVSGERFSFVEEAKRKAAERNGH